MSFNIQKILDSKPTIDTKESEFVSKVNLNENHLNTTTTTSFPSQTSTSLAAKALYAIANDIKSPSLTELQMLFGFDAHKHEYKRNRKSAGDRKPRQAYSALQLETLENEFANKMEERNDKLVKGILSTNSHQQFYITTAAD